MTLIQIEVMKKYAEAILSYIPPCPWNPFPLDSKWGWEIEQAYSRDQIKRRQQRYDDDWHDNGW